MSVLQDWRSNQGAPRVQVMLALLRLSQLLRKKSRLVAAPVTLVYRAYSAILVGADIPPQTSIGPRLVIHHGVGIVINGRTRIGSDVTIRQNSTLGSRDDSGAAPDIADGVDIGAHVLVLGGIRLGERARIGAGAIVVNDVPAGAVAVGAPATVREAK